MGMTRQELIDKMTDLTAPSRNVDVAIAEHFSFSRKKAMWYDPDGKEFRILPHFTTNIDAAKYLCDLVMPEAPGGFSFHDGYAKAAVAGGEPAVAFNPATALCLALVQTAAL